MWSPYPDMLFGLWHLMPGLVCTTFIEQNCRKAERRHSGRILAHHHKGVVALSPPGEAWLPQVKWGGWWDHVAVCAAPSADRRSCAASKSYDIYAVHISGYRSHFNARFKCGQGNCVKVTLSMLGKSHKQKWINASVWHRHLCQRSFQCVVNLQIADFKC